MENLGSHCGLAELVTLSRDCWGHSDLAVRGEILRPATDGLLRKHLSRMFPRIKIESQGIEDD